MCTLVVSVSVYTRLGSGPQAVAVFRLIMKGSCSPTVQQRPSIRIVKAMSTLFLEVKSFFSVKYSVCISI